MFEEVEPGLPSLIATDILESWAREGMGYVLNLDDIRLRYRATSEEIAKALALVDQWLVTRSTGGS